MISRLIRDVFHAAREGRKQPSRFRPALPEPHSARTWLAHHSDRENTAIWTQLGALDIPSGLLFVGDPTSGHDDHMLGAKAAGASALEVWALQDERSGANHLIWLEAAGTLPTHKRRQHEFGVDAATIGLGDATTGHAFAALTDIELDAGRGDNFDWLMPHIQEAPHFAKWVDIPPDSQFMLIASTGTDGSFAAVWLHDSTTALCGILIDISGRRSDQLFLDKLLPDA